MGCVTIVISLHSAEPRSDHPASGRVVGLVTKYDFSDFCQQRWRRRAGTSRRRTWCEFRTFTHILALDRANLADLRRRGPADATPRLGLLLDHVTGRAGDAVADPYFGDEAGFEATWNDVAAAAEALVLMLGTDV